MRASSKQSIPLSKDQESPTAADERRLMGEKTAIIIGSRVSKENVMEAVVMIQFRCQLRQGLTAKASSDGWHTCSLLPHVLNIAEP